MFLAIMQALHLSNNGMKSLPSKIFKTCLQLSTLDLHNTEITIDILRKVWNFAAFFKVMSFRFRRTFTSKLCLRHSLRKYAWPSCSLKGGTILMNAVAQSIRNSWIFVLEFLEILMKVLIKNEQKLFEQKIRADK